MSISDYIKDTKGEMKHVSWPTRRQTTLFTILVVAISVIVSAYLGVFDYLFTVILGKFIF